MPAAVPIGGGHGIAGGNMMTTLLEMRGISKIFPGVRALDHVNLSVEAGEIHAICGENGAGS